MLILQKGFKKEEPKDVMVRLNGDTFRCDCGCNVFRHPINKGTRKLIENKYVCNSCGRTYTGE